MGIKTGRGLLLLKDRNFALVWAGQLTSKIGNGINFVAVTWLVYELTGSPMKTGLAVMCQIVPCIVLGPFFGHWLDKTKSRKHVMIWADLLQASLVSSIPILASLDWMCFWYICAVLLVNACCGEIFSIAMNSALPSMVPVEDLRTANALVSGTLQTGKFFGPFLAALLMSQMHTVKVLYVDAATFVLSAVTLSIAHFKVDVGTGPANSQRMSISEGLTEAVLHIIKGNRVIGFIILAVGALNFFTPSLTIVMPVYCDRVLGVGQEGFAFVMSGWGAGTFMAFLLLAAVKRQVESHLWIMWCYAISGLLLLCLSISRLLTLATFLFALTGFFIAVAGVLNFTFIQQQTPPSMLARTIALYGAASHATIPPGLIACGFFLNDLAADYMIATIGMCVAVVGMGIALIAGRLTEASLLRQ